MTAVQVVVFRRGAGEVPNSNQLVVAERKSGNRIANTKESAARIRVVVTVATDIGEGRMIMVDARVDYAHYYSFTFCAGSTAGRRTVPHAGCANPGWANVSLKLINPLSLNLLYTGHARNL